MQRPDSHLLSRESVDVLQSESVVHSENIEDIT